MDLDIKRGPDYRVSRKKKKKKMSIDALVYYTEHVCFKDGGYPRGVFATVLDLSQHGSRELFFASWIVPFVLGYLELYHFLLSLGGTLNMIAGFVIQWGLEWVHAHDTDPGGGGGGVDARAKCGDAPAGFEPHTSYAFFLYVVLVAFLIEKRFHVSVQNIFVMTAFPALVALARMELEYNKFSDVAAGAVFGAVSGAAWHVFVFAWVAPRAQMITESYVFSRILCVHDNIFVDRGEKDKNTNDKDDEFTRRGLMGRDY